MMTSAPKRQIPFIFNLLVVFLACSARKQEAGEDNDQDGCREKQGEPSLGLEIFHFFLLGIFFVVIQLAGL